ncbi:MAG: ABC transporter permease [Deltaproteobacteria bacterium]|nr:ABC transporter permease [Deltaproteobacteria bacterium]
MKMFTYEPDNSLKKGYLSVFSEIVEDISANRWLTYQLFKRDFISLYKQSFIGVFWSFIIPLVSVGTFVLLNRSGVFAIGPIDAPYAIYGLLGVALWQLFSAGLVSGGDALVKAGSMIVMINFSKKSLVLASQGRSIVAFIIQFSLVLALCVYYRFAPSLNVVFLPLLLLPLIVLSVGLGFIFSLLNAVVRDVGNALSIVMTFLMFITPVLYPKPASGLLALISTYNPLYYLVSVPRDLMLSGTVREKSGYILAVFLSLAVSCFCIIVFHLTETRVTERV